MSRDLERSVKDRIKSIAKSQDRAFNDVWKALALERFLARLARSNRVDNLIFKGGFLLGKYLPLGRETVDLDFSLTGTDGALDSVKDLIQGILSIPYDDGFIFEGLEVTEMNHPHMAYPGYEAKAVGRLGHTRTKIKIDLGIGDRVKPEGKTLPLLSLGDKPLFESSVSIRAYPLSYIVAEKMEAIVYRGGTNSRMKDFYDLIVLSQHNDFSIKEHTKVIHAVFEHRRTPRPSTLSYDSSALKTLSQNWKRFIGTLEDQYKRNVPAEFSTVITQIDRMIRELE